ncbi:hypothetical protein NMG60_11016569 [Bertholletia excelsa]
MQMSMTMLGQSPGGSAAMSASTRSSFSSSLHFHHPHHSSSLFAHRRPKFPSRRLPNSPIVAKAEASAGGGGPATKPGAPPPTSLGAEEPISVVGEESVPLEGVIQFEKPNSSASVFNKWGLVALLSGGDVLALLLFSAIGRFSHGFSVFDTDTLRTADPFIAGWFLSAYFLGGYGEDGRGMNGVSKAVIAAAKSWAVGIPLGLVIRAATVGHVPPSNFVLVTMGSAALLLVGWRALLFSIFFKDESKKDDMYRRGSPFELFELLTSLVRRW